MLGKSLASKTLSLDAGLVERTKHEICAHFVQYKVKEKISQRELAQQLEVTESRVSEILHYHYERIQGSTDGLQPHPK